MSAESVIRSGILAAIPDALADPRLVVPPGVGSYRAVDPSLALSIANTYRVIFLPLLPAPNIRTRLLRSQVRVQVVAAKSEDAQFFTDVVEKLPMFRQRLPITFTDGEESTRVRFTIAQTIQGPRTQGGLVQYDVAVAATYT